MREIYNYGWQFAKIVLDNANNVVSESLENSTDKIKWEEVSLPHDWLIYDTKNLYESSIGLYRRYYEWHGDTNKRIALYFEGVYMDSALYVNGAKIGEWKYGYSSFEIEITPFLIKGKNEIIVKVIYMSPNSRWYSGAGVYRNVWRYERPMAHFASDGVYIATEKKENGYQLYVNCEIDSISDQYKNYAIDFLLYDSHGELIMQNTTEPFIVSKDSSSCKADFHVSEVMEWSVENPALYYIKCKLHQNGLLLDETINTFGFRRVFFDANEGFFLNGQPIELKGVCEHHDLGCLGAAVNKRAIRKRLQLLKEMGVNAIRTAHNMPCIELLELTDEMGFVVINEAFDMWEKPKTRYDYARFFKEWYQRDVRSWIRRDRNHPSVILWSIGNEIYDTHHDAHGLEITKGLLCEIAKHDPRGNGKATIGSNYLAWENTQKCADLIKIVGYNYGDRLYEEDHRKHPDWVIYGSETASLVQSRGIYHFPYATPILTDDDEQCSSLGNSATSWGADSIEQCIIAQRDCSFSFGQFIWTGFDYIGEPTPYHTKNSYFGQIDTAGFPKDAFYMYQAQWTDYRSEPMVHLFPYWDFTDEQAIDVRICSNAPFVELYHDGVSLGKKSLDHKKGSKLTADWILPYINGKLEAIAYDNHNNIIARDTRNSFGEAARICLEIDKPCLAYKCSDLVYVTVSVVDEHGHLVENANNLMHVSINGSAYIAGMDNGDSTDFEPYKTNTRRLFSGKLAIAIASTNEDNPMDVKVEVYSPGLASEVITITAEKENMITPIDYKELIAKNPSIARRTVYSGCIDEFFDFSLGHLANRTVHFADEVKDCQSWQSTAVVNYADANVPYTRTIEHKHFEFGTQLKTVISYEYPTEWKPGMEPMYPVNDESNQQRLKEYEEMAMKRPDVVFGGRLGTYRYYDMDKVIRAALDLAEKENATSSYLSRFKWSNSLIASRRENK